jgi:hypothetical protein
MTYNPHDDWRPDPEMLAAYADGELDAAECHRLEDWLLDHPADSQKIEEHRRFTRLYKSTRPGEPTESAWAAARARVQARYVREAHKRWSGANWRRWILPFAAAVLIALWVGRGPRLERLEPAAAPAPFPVASPLDVEIISLDPADSQALVVGELPAREAFMAATPHDIIVRSMMPDTDGKVPVLRVSHDPATMPVLVAPGAPDERK